MRLISHLCILILGCSLSFSPDSAANIPPQSQLSKFVVNSRTPLLESLFDQQTMQLGSQVYIRVFKASKELEVWIKDDKYKLYKTYPICTYSGNLGPKQKQGDKQSPEGYYGFSAQNMNPWSNFHLSFNIGYPNKLDRLLNRTGNHLMVHGKCSSSGCFAMTDPLMEEIYTICQKAFEAGQQQIPVHIFPFRMTNKNLRKHQDSDWYEFWTTLKPGYDFFETYKIPPNIIVKNNAYTLG